MSVAKQTAHGLDGARVTVFDGGAHHECWAVDWIELGGSDARRTIFTYGARSRKMKESRDK